MKSLPNHSIYIPHIVNPNIIFRKARNQKSFNILFLGAYNHPPNRISFKYIIDKILPKLIKTKQQFKIHVIGSNTKKFQVILNNSKYKDLIVLHGFVEDINNVFDEMDIALFPILYGGGIKTKVIDALAAGIPVVTTPQGIVGLIDLPQNAIGVCNTVNGIVNELKELMNDFSLRLERSKLGKDYVDNQHSYKIFAEKVKEAYLEI
jgi:glycosyltransferase involved in cell wall biosynthesis